MGYKWVTHADGSASAVFVDDTAPSPGIGHNDGPRLTADARFMACIPLVLAHEGGFVDNKADPGGATKHGISLRYARTRGSLFDLDHNGVVDKADILRVTPEFAAMVYRQWFWADVRGDDLPAGVDYAMFDYAVNSGAGRPIKAVQRLVGVPVDGFIGPQTLTAIQRRPAAALVESIQAERLAFLRSLSTWATFGKGWGRRVEEVRVKAVAMAKAAG